MVKEELLALLVCPLGKAPLRREGEILICTRCGPRFSIKDDIPNMLIEEAELPAGTQFAGRLGVRKSRRGQARLIDRIDRAGQSGHHDRRSFDDLDRVADLHLTPLPQLDLAVYIDLTGGDQRLAGTAAFHAAS